MPDASDLLENSTFFEVLLCIISGKDYSSSIAKFLKKTQPTVTEQLKKMESAKIIKALNRKKAQAYEVNWDLFFEIFYDTTYDALTLRKEFFKKDALKRITRASLEGIIPRNLLKEFLKKYYSALSNLDGKRKGFDEIIFSFFLALKELDKKDWKKLIKQYGIDEENLTTVTDSLGFEIYGIEQTALIVLLEDGESNKHE